jgi:hypothetical protein
VTGGVFGLWNGWYWQNSYLPAAKMTAA